MYRNEVSQLEDYREKVFELLPGVSFIDSVDREGKDVEESDLEEDEPKEVNGKSEEILSNMLNHGLSPHKVKLLLADFLL